MAVRKALRKGFLLGIGIASLTTKKVRKEVLKFLAQNKINKKDAESFTRQFLKQANAGRKKYQAIAKKETAAALRKAKAVYAKEMALVKKRLKKRKR